MQKHVKKKRQRDAHENVFAVQLASLHGGAPADVVLREVFGGCVRGLAWQHDVATLMRTARIDEGAIVEEQQRPLNHPVARKLLRFVLLCLGRFRRFGKHWGIVGQEGFWGVQCDKRRRSNEELRELKRKQLELELSGGDPSTINTDRWARTYRPTGKQGGIAAAMDMSARNVGRYAALVRTMKLFGSKQPSKNQLDQTFVILPKDGDFAYPIWGKMRPLASLTLQLLRAARGEFNRPAPEPMQEPSTPSRAPRPSSPPHTGPPTSSGAVGALDEDPTEDIDDSWEAIREECLQLESELVAALYH